MKKCAALLAFLYFCAMASAQLSYVTVSATVSDPNTIPYANAQYSIMLVDANGYPVSSASTPNGQLFNAKPITGILDPTGFFTAQVVPNSILSKPSGTQWKISISAPTDSAILVYQPVWTINYQQAFTTTTDLSSQLSALAQPVTFINLKTSQSSISASDTIARAAAAAAQSTANTAQSTATSAQSTATSAQSTATSAQSTATAAQTVANAALPGRTSNPTAATDANGVHAQVNNVIPVTSYGAKGDCVTDDSAALQAAQTAALTYSPPADLYFPRSGNGSCYLTSTFDWVGVNLIGDDSGGDASSVIIKGKPGQDVIHVKDFALTAFSWNNSWHIENIRLFVDATTNGVFPHRFPGRWFDDGAITTGTTAFSTTNAVATCNDAGENILVGGAGPTAATTTLASSMTSGQTTINFADATNGSWPVTFGLLKIDSEIMMYVGTQANGLTTLTVMRGQSGTTAASHSSGATVTVMGNLVTTIVSVTPCWATGAAGSHSWQKITLAAAASNTVSSSHSYISVDSLPVTSTVGNAAIAMDNFDAKPADWPNGGAGQKQGSGDPILHNISIYGSGSGSTNTAAIWTQGNQGWYGADVQNFTIRFVAFGIVEACAEINPVYSPCANDFQKWSHGSIEIATHPWIQYNGGEQTIEDVELSTTWGPFWNSTGNNFADSTGSWRVHMPEIELNNTGGKGFRIQGLNMIFTNTSFSGGGTAYLNMTNSVCYGCNSNGPIQLGGFGNHLHFARFATITNTGLNNVADYSYASSPQFGFQPNYDIPLIPQKGYAPIQSVVTADSMHDGNTGISYNWNDLFMWPTDYVYNGFGSSDWTTVVLPDSTSPSGYYINMTSSVGLTNFSQNNMTIGTSFPIGPVQVYFMASCPAGTTTFSMHMMANGGGFGNFNDIGTSPTFNCNTTYQKYTWKVDGSAYVGANGDVATTGATIHLAWLDFQPWPSNHNINGDVNITGNFKINSSQITMNNLADVTDSGASVGNYLKCTAVTSGNCTNWTPATVATSTSGLSDWSNAAASVGYTASCASVSGGSCTSWAPQASSAATTANVPGWLMFLGDGTDGAPTCTSGCTLQAGEYWFTSLNVPTGQTLKVGNLSNGALVMRVSGACTIAGTLSYSVNTGSSKGNGPGNNADFGGSGGGGGGGTGAGTVGGATVGITGSGGGGTAGAASGGAAGSGSTAASYIQRQAMGGTTMPTPGYTSSNFVLMGGGGGGTGGTSGPSGGQGGSAIILDCASLSFTGTVDVSGQNGNPSTANNMGASGGGGGGFTILRSPSFTTNTGTINVSGGTGGSCGAFTGCGAGGNGGTGWSKVFTQ